MNKKFRRSDFFMLLPSVLPVVILFVAPLIYSLVLAFSTPVTAEDGNSVYTDGKYEYVYNVKTNRYDQMDGDKATGEELKPYDIKSQPDVYKEQRKTRWGNWKSSAGSTERGEGA